MPVGRITAKCQGRTFLFPPLFIQREQGRGENEAFERFVVANQVPVCITFYFLQ